MDTIKFSTSAAVLASAVMPGTWMTKLAALHSPVETPSTSDAHIQSVGALVPASADVWTGFTNVEADTEESAHSIILPEVLHWNRSTEKRFKELAVKESLAEITASERKELDALDQLRERDLCPPSGEEFMRQYRGRQVTAALMLALKEYVSFYGQPPGGDVVSITSSAY